MRSANFPDHCGTKIIHDFWAFEELPYKYPTTQVKTLIGIFINAPEQQKSYEKMKKKYKILYQSPLMKNPSTKRDYFIVIWINGGR